MEVPDIAWINTLNVDKKWDEDQSTSLKREQRSFLKLKIDNDYRERYGKILEKYDPNHVVPNAFKYNPGQY